MIDSNYTDTVLSLFGKDNHKTILKMVSANDGILDTGIMFRACYDMNLLVTSLSYIIKHKDYTNNCSLDISNVEPTNKKDVIVSDECKKFIDKLESFGNIIRGKATKKELYSCYIGYLFLTDSCVANELISTCTTSNDRQTVTKGLKNGLSSAYELPSNQIFTKYGRFLTNPLDVKLDDCIGRDKEISEIIDIMCRKKKNNPVLVGQPGVGKTCLVEGFAKLLMSDKCPKFLQGYHIYEVSLSQMIAGCKYRGDYEERLENLFSAVKESTVPIIIFIDEIHNLMTDSKDKSSGMSAADIVKPYLTDGTIRIIGATTPQEYKFIEKDGAIDRRFNKVMIREPSIDVVKYIIKNAKADYEKHFNINIPEDVIDSMIFYANKYVPNKYMPDKIFDLLDRACVYCVNHSKSDILTEMDIVKATESVAGIAVPTAKELIGDKISKIITNINNNLIGQTEAVAKIENTIKKYFLGLTNPNKPIGSFLFVGSSGVGKTQLCKELATNMFTRESFIRFDMSEYMEKHSVSKLFGAPPGYVGYGDGGLLTDAVKNNPFSVVLFDEIEKAHEDVYNTLLQILDDGVLTDGTGEKVYFNNCIIVLTSNVGTRDVSEKSKPSIGFGNSEMSNNEINKVYEQAVKKQFRPEFINRLDNIIYFNTLSESDISKIIKLEINKLKAKYNDINIVLNVSTKVINKLTKKCYVPEYGARFVQRTIANDVENVIIDYMLDNNIVSSDEKVRIDVTIEKDSVVCAIPKTVDA